MKGKCYASTYIMFIVYNHFCPFSSRVPIILKLIVLWLGNGGYILCSLM